MEKTIAVVEDRLFLEHRAPEGHPERPERLFSARQALEQAALEGALDRLAPRDATDDELARVHTGRYLEMLGKAAGRSGYFDGDTYFTPGSVSAARRAAGGVLSIVDALLGGSARFGVALVRPPGHHARPDGAMGFCLLNNIAIAAAHARARGARKVAVVDWDVHHGNGTQEAFYGDPSVLYVSLHQFPFYPGTGSTEEAGTRDGQGFTLNVPLSAGAGDETYLAAFERIVAPAISEYAPDLLLVSAGFDAHARDPLGGMRVTESGFAEMGRILRRALPEGASGRIALVLEGGYDLTGLGASLRATVEALDGGGPPAPTRSPGDELPRDVGRALGAARRYFSLD